MASVKRDFFERAACRGRWDVMLFIDESPTAVARAKEFCARCPVVEECRDYAFDVRADYGVWGGLSSSELRRHFRNLRKAGRVPLYPPHRPRIGGNRPDRHMPGGWAEAGLDQDSLLEPDQNMGL